jgi:hypothetical protein
MLLIWRPHIALSQLDSITNSLMNRSNIDQL